MSTGRVETHVAVLVALAMAVGVCAVGSLVAGAENADAKSLLFCIGTPDGYASEFGLAAEGYGAFARKYTRPIVYTVGKSDLGDWPCIHPAHGDTWAGSRAYTFTINFQSAADQNRPLFLLIGTAGAHATERSNVTVTVNETALPVRVAPSGVTFYPLNPTFPCRPDAMVFEIAAGSIEKGGNTLSIRLDGGGYVVYDYVALGTERKPLKLVKSDPPGLLAEFRKGPMQRVDEIIFVVRPITDDPHWYTNFGYYADNVNRLAYERGARLCRLNLNTGGLTVLLEERNGGIRDPVVHYDGRKILFSYRKDRSAYYHLYEIGPDGSGLRQLTDGPYDDIEPTYLPDGGIMFVSSRCKRWVNCWMTQVAVLYRCNADGRDIRILSSNIEHDNTPWVLSSGQVLYTRWEYVDRSQVDFHHLWVSSPDGARQTVFYGNMHPGTVIIDAKPIPGSRKVVASFSARHGDREHSGVVAIIDPRSGPDDLSSARAVSRGAGYRDRYRDPWAFSEDAFMAAQYSQIVLMDGIGRTQVIYKLPEDNVAAGLQCHEPRPLCSRPREPVMPAEVDWTKETGRLLLQDVYTGRNMDGVRRGDIKNLLVLETLPKPINFNGGMEPISHGGTFTLVRVLGTIPVEPDGSAYAELPALRSLFFVALDQNDMAVKRMQSFLTVMPGETTTCVGCHEQRTTSPRYPPGEMLALRREPNRIEPITDVPDVFDYPRDIQPILDRHCVECHDDDKREGGVVLSGDRGPMFSVSYYTLTAKNLVSDGRSFPKGNHPPRTLGSSASRLMQLIDGSHYEAKVSPRERKMIRLWIETGAAYPGTYAALGSGMIGSYASRPSRGRLRSTHDRSDTAWPSMIAATDALNRRCSNCHKEKTALPLSPSDDLGAPPYVPLSPDDVRRRFSCHLLYNLSRPNKSLILLAPLSKEGGGFQLCGEPVFADTADPDYRKVLLAIQDTKKKLDEIKRFDMPGFRPPPQYVREMKRYGILPAGPVDDEPIDVYATERAYWNSLWCRNVSSGQP